MFKAKKLTATSFALFNGNAEFARLQHVTPRWIISTSDDLLKTVFNSTEFAADATVTDVLRAIRCIVDHIAILTEHAAKFIADGFTVRDLALISCVIERGLPLAPRDIKLDVQPDADEGDGGALIENPVTPPQLPPRDALEIPFDVAVAA